MHPPIGVMTSKTLEQVFGLARASSAIQFGGRKFLDCGRKP